MFSRQLSIFPEVLALALDLSHRLRIEVGFFRGALESPLIYSNRVHVVVGFFRAVFVSALDLAACLRAVV